MVSSFTLCWPFTWRRSSPIRKCKCCCVFFMSTMPTYNGCTINNEPTCTNNTFGFHVPLLFLFFSCDTPKHSYGKRSSLCCCFGRLIKKANKSNETYRAEIDLKRLKEDNDDAVAFEVAPHLRSPRGRACAAYAVEAASRDSVPSRMWSRTSPESKFVSARGRPHRPTRRRSRAPARRLASSPQPPACRRSLLHAPTARTKCASGGCGRRSYGM